MYGIGRFQTHNTGFDILFLNSRVLILPPRFWIDGFPKFRYPYDIVLRLLNQGTFDVRVVRLPLNDSIV